MATANYAFNGSNVYYNNSSSRGSYSNVQDSITELYSKVYEANFVDHATYWYSTRTLTSGTNAGKTSNSTRTYNYNEKQQNSISDGGTSKCIYDGTINFDYDGFFIIKLTGTHGGATDNSSYATPSLYSVDTDAVRLTRPPGTSQSSGATSLSNNVYKSGGTDFAEAYYVYKVHKGNYFKDAVCMISGHSGVLYPFAYGISDQTR